MLNSWIHEKILSKLYSVFHFLPSQVLQERLQVSQQVSRPVDWLGHVVKQDITKCA